MQQRQQDEEAPRQFPHARRHWLVVAASMFLVLGAGVDYLRELELVPDSLRIPLRELVVSQELKSVDAVPSHPGALSGQNLLIVTLDTTRPDRLGCYGNGASVSPNLDRLARDGIVFSGATAVTSTTLPAHASILTGLYPYHHGARANSVFRLDDRHRTLPDILSAQGYATAAFVSSFVLDARFGLNQGFDHYDDGPMGKVSRFGPARRRADETTERALAWLRLPRTRPFFLWVHYYDAHSPYEPPPPFEKMHENRYDGAIAFVDEQLGRLLKEVASAPGPGTLVVVTADHGEALGEHGEETHGLLVQEATLRIPLVVRPAHGLSAAFTSADAYLGRSRADSPVATRSRCIQGPRRPGPDGRSGRLRGDSARTRGNSRGPGQLWLGEVDGALSRHPQIRRRPTPSSRPWPGPAGADDLAVTPGGNREEHEERDQMEALARRLRPLLSADETDTSVSRPSLSGDEIARLRSLGYLVADAHTAPQVPLGPFRTREDAATVYASPAAGRCTRIDRQDAAPTADAGWLSKKPLPSRPRRCSRLSRRWPRSIPISRPSMCISQSCIDTRTGPRKHGSWASV